MTVTLITLARNAVTLSYPWREAVMSMSDLADQVIINAGRSDDGTVELAEQIAADVDGEVLTRDWDDSRGGFMLADETQAAMDRAGGDWILYVQADEVMHEAGIELVRENLESRDPRVLGLTFQFVHHYANPETVATSRKWYRHELRAVRSHPDIRSHHHAQGFRLRGKRVPARPSGGVIHHYGWCRGSRALGAKRAIDGGLYHGASVDDSTRRVLPWEWGLEPFQGTHPAVVEGWLERVRSDCAHVGPQRLGFTQARLAVSDLLERMLGTELFRFRNFDWV